MSLFVLTITLVSLMHRKVTSSGETHEGIDTLAYGKDAFMNGIPRANGSKAENNSTFEPAMSIEEAERSSSVDYFSCCGAGHRLSKMADAHYLAKFMGFGLRSFFGFCGKQEIFSYLFGSQPLEELQTVAKSTPGLILRINNDVAGFYKLRRNGAKEECQCPKDRMSEDVRFYSSLRDRFRHKRVVERFLDDHFQSPLVIGMHLRLGNGEGGDFRAKNRTLSDPTWFRQMADRIIDLADESLRVIHAKEESELAGVDAPQSARSQANSRHNNLPVLFLATDTESSIDTFSKLLSGRMNVISFDQARPEVGSGVFFGQSFHSSASEQEELCLSGWVNTFVDMMLLSYTDVLVAARPSSFTQSLPMSLVLSKERTSRKTPTSYCEVDSHASRLWCFENSMEWCCSGETDFSLAGIQRYDYLRMPDKSYFAENSSEAFLHVTARPILARECIPTPKFPARQCLPYKMPNRTHVEQEGNMADVIRARKMKRIGGRKKKVKGDG